MNLLLSEIAHYGDMLAIPFFLLAFIYFYKKQNKTSMEYILLAFVLIGLICDIVFTYMFMSSN